MADRGRSEIGKSVKNPLLSGASGAFSFDNFPGTALLVPVNTESTPALLEDVGEVDTFVGQEKSAADDLNLAASVPFSAAAQTEPRNQGYTGLFSSFFGGSQPQKVDQVQEVKPPDNFSLSSTPRSFSPYVHVPSVESYSPALFVPEEPQAQVPPILKNEQAQSQPLTGFSAKPPAVPAAVGVGRTVHASGPIAEQTLYTAPIHSSLSGVSTQTSNLSSAGAQVDGYNTYSQQFAPASTPLLARPSEAPKISAPSSSSSSSSDSIVTDLQSKFGGTSIDDNCASVIKPVSHADVVPGGSVDHDKPSESSDHHGLLGIFSSDQYPELQATSDFFGLPQDPSDNSYQTQSPALHSFGAIGQPRVPTYPFWLGVQPQDQFLSAPYSSGAVGEPSIAAPPIVQEAIRPPPNRSQLSTPTNNTHITSNPSTSPASTFTVPQGSHNSNCAPFAQETDSSGSLSQFPNLPPLVPKEPHIPSGASGQLGAVSSVPRSIAGGAKSYRLGAQKRLAYAPVPGLVSSPPSQTAQLGATTFAAPPSIFSPKSTEETPAIYNPAVTYHTSGQTATPQLFVPPAESSEGLTLQQQSSSTVEPPKAIPSVPSPAAESASALNTEAPPQTSSPAFNAPKQSVIFGDNRPSVGLPPTSSLEFTSAAINSYPTGAPAVSAPVVSLDPPQPYESLVTTPATTTSCVDNRPSAFAPPTDVFNNSSQLFSSDRTLPINSGVIVSPTELPLSEDNRPFPSVPPTNVFKNSPSLFSSERDLQINSGVSAPPRALPPRSNVSTSASTNPYRSTASVFSSPVPLAPNQPPIANPQAPLFSSTSFNPQSNASSLFTSPAPAPYDSFFNPASHSSNIFTPINPQSEPLPDITPAPPTFYSFTPASPAPFPGASNLFSPITSNESLKGSEQASFPPNALNYPVPAAEAPQVLPAMTTPDDPGMLNTIDLSSPTSPRRSPSPSVVPQRLLNLGQSGIIYRPPYYHWFWNKDVDGKEDWQPFSMTDSFELEQAYNSDALTMDTVVATDGGRHDVQIVARRRDAVYWQEPSRDVLRCSWFYKPADTFVPYDENTAAILEEEYKAAVMTSSWKRQVPLKNGSYVVLFGPSTMAHYSTEVPSPDGWDASTELTQSGRQQAREVKRGVEDFNIEDGESPEIDHLLFFVHGIGSVCDLKLRTIEEAVRDFRSTAQELLKTHYRTCYDQGEVTRIEVLPVSWHQNLHSDTGVDEKLKKITLKSIPRLRHFTNDTLLDILFYTSPVYCQNIVQQVGQELNKLYELFRDRNPRFKGGVSVAGHSLGSLILFDMLCHQKRPNDNPKEECSSEDSNSRVLTRTASYVMGNAGTGQPCVTYPQLNFQPNSFFALGSPIGMFVTVRGIDSLGLDFQLPTCPGFYNIFHPYDPVAYRIEVLINPDLASKRPVLIPHHKGRKRMHLELRDTVARLGTEFKQKVVDSVRNTWNAVYQYATSGGEHELEQEMNRAMESEMVRTRLESESTIGTDEEEQQGLNSGVVNQGRRIDYVLQEAPLESLNEYLSAIVSHVCYWDSEDTVLFILKDIYNNMGISAESPVANNEDSITPTRSPSAPSPLATPATYTDPTAPMDTSAPPQPPPTFGFVRK